MLSVRSFRSLLLTFYGLIALLLMSGSAVFAAHANVHVLSDVVLQQSAVSSTTEANSASELYGWQKISTDDSSDDGVMLVDDGDIDDEPALPASFRVSLGYSRADVPLSGNAFLYPVPAALLLRPPRIA
jgi:hypothetical protein